MTLVVMLASTLITLKWSTVDAVKSPSTDVSSWDSSPFNLQHIGENSLGLITKACSQLFCYPRVSSLDLWLDLGKVCVETRLLPSLDTVESSTQAPENVKPWSPYLVGAVCGIVAGASLFAGYKVGSNRRRILPMLFV